MKLVLCSSVAFYEHVCKIADELQATGNYSIVIPKSARAMREAKDFTVNKTWFGNPDDYDKKADYMRTHFDEISAGDAILVVNDEKHGKANYIGANVLLEMSLAWYQHKPIYLLNALPSDSPFEEEIKGMMPVVLHGNLDALPYE
ncbi:MAG TPA: hypothetical protein PL051_03440 [Candidatus Saccharibacteria bacterium]|nr:hypothetical protein [Candidatus Saccharibacteria bacterium]